MIVRARGFVDGAACGRLALLSAPLSLWGGLDLSNGLICDATHPQCGADLKGRVLAMHAARGSSSSSSALVEAVRRGAAPAAIVLERIDPILVIGALVAADLYGVRVPVVTIGAEYWPLLENDRAVSVESADGEAFVRAR